MELADTPPALALVEDDGPLRTLLARTMRERGFAVSGFASAAEYRPVAMERSFDLVILDVMLPGASGLDLCRWIRERSDTPVIFISARSSQTDRIVGLELGADDYVVKPVDPDELIARVRAVLRRSRLGPGRDGEDALGVVRFDGWTLDQRRRELFAPGGERIVVSEAEFDLLTAMADMPQRVISRGHLLEQARGRLPGEDDRSVDVLVSRLRRKLGAVEGGRDLIRTVRGLGYIFVPAVQR